MVNFFNIQLEWLRMWNKYPNGGSLERILQKQIADTRTYDTFGNLVGQDGSSKGNLSFQCKYFDRESGMYYYYQRYYHPLAGRFINEDPLRFSGSDNFYVFTGNNPVNYSDAFGLTPFTNNYDRSIPYKPEDTCGSCDKTKKYECPPGATCDVDGVYPPDGGNPIKIADGCDAECKDGKLKINCKSLISLICQIIRGGQKSDDWMNDNVDWPIPEAPTNPYPENK